MTTSVSTEIATDRELRPEFAPFLGLMDFLGALLGPRSEIVLHDTSEFSYTREDNQIKKTRKLRIGKPKKNMVGEKQYYTKCGVLMHASLAVSAENLPLGLGALKFWTRKDFKGTREQKNIFNPTRVPIEEKESFRWIESLRLSTERFGAPGLRLRFAALEPHCGISSAGV